MVKLLMLEKPKLGFDIDPITIKENKAFTKGNQKIPTKLFQDYCLDDRLGIDWNFTFFDKCETHKQLKERKTFWHH